MIRTYCDRCRREGSRHARNRWRSPPHPAGAPHVGRRWWLFTIRLGGTDGPIVAYRQNYASYARVTRAARRSYAALVLALQTGGGLR